MKPALILAGALIGAAAIALVLLLDGGAGRASETDSRTPGAGSGSAEGAGALSLQSGPQRVSGAEPARSSWSVRVVDAEGQGLADARIQATRGARVLEGTGSVEWFDVKTGTWTLVATGDGLPVWRRDIQVEGERTDTVIQLTPGVRIDGRVRDSAGRDQPGRIVGFVPRGERAPVIPARWLELPHTRTRADGSFSMLLPEEGDWRLFVGWGGEVAFEEPGPKRLVAGGQSYVDVTVPAPTRLLVEVVDLPVLEPKIHHGVSVYRVAERIAADRAAVRLAVPARAPGHGAGEVADEDEESALERETVERHEEDVRGREDDPEVARLRALRMAVVPSGWAKEKTGFCGSNGRVEFERLPVEEELRFAVSRGPEAFAVDGGVYIPAGTEVLVRIELPPPLGAGAPPLSTPRRVSALVQPPGVDEGESRTPGATWR